MTMHRLDGVVHTHFTKKQRRALFNHLGVRVAVVGIHRNSIAPSNTWSVKFRIDDNLSRPPTIDL
jgi:hypothetical protein